MIASSQACRSALGRSALPHAVALRIIFALLAADARARCATVCRGWRLLVADASLWTRLDLSRASGVSCRVTDEGLRAAAARAGGALEALDVDGADDVSQAALLAVVAANGGTLRELRTGSRYRIEERTLLQAAGVGAASAASDHALTVLTVLRTAPALRTWIADVACFQEQVAALLRNEPPYGALRLRGLTVRPVPCRPSTDAELLALAAALPAHASLRSLELCWANLQSAATCDALVDAALALQLQSLALAGCAFAATSVPALARLLGGGALTELRLTNCNGLLDEPEAAAELAAALRASTTLTSLELRDFNMWRQAEGSGALLLGAVTGHPSLQTLSCLDLHPQLRPEAAGLMAALGALLAANAPALTALHLPCGVLHLGPLWEALPRNTHLRALSVGKCTEEDATAHLLPALRANASLRELHITRITSGRGRSAAFDEVDRLLAAHAAAD